MALAVQAVAAALTTPTASVSQLVLPLLEPSIQGTPRRKHAWEVIPQEETDLSPQELAATRVVFRNNPELAVKYLSFPSTHRAA